jgi:hypothetical protein
VRERERERDVLQRYYENCAFTFAEKNSGDHHGLLALHTFLSFFFFRCNEK